MKCWEIIVNNIMIKIYNFYRNWKVEWWLFKIFKVIFVLYVRIKMLLK